MFQRLKKKIRYLFSDEQDLDRQENEQDIKPSSKGKHIETRMTYQYPAKKAFRFPIIPDESDTERDRNDEMSDFRRRSRNVNVNEKDIKQDNNQQESREKSREIYHSESKTPFIPTDVPSPIHGFQNPEEEKQTEDSLAVQKESLQNTQEVKHEENQNEIKDSSTTAESPERINLSGENGREQITSSDNVRSESEETAYIEKEESPQPSTAVSESEKPIQSNDAIEPQEKKRTQPYAESKDNQKAYKSSNDSNKNGTPPFNVLMSTNDKRNQQKKSPSKKTDITNNEHRDVPADIPDYLLDDPAPQTSDDQLWLDQERELLEKTLKHFNVRAHVVNTTQGPSVTRFEVQPELGVKVSKIKNLSDDLKLNMAAEDIRIEAPIPGKNTIGIEIPNQYPQTVSLQEIIAHQDFQTSKSPLTVGLGLSIEGEPQITDIQKMPHGLIAGATGSGKSVCINTILISLIYKTSYEDVKFMLIDPKMVELAPYNGIPHLISPVITDVKAATAALKWAVKEMERRYEAFVRENVRDVERFNRKMIQQNRTEEKMTYMVIVIDELADLMMIAPQDVEDSISRIAQKARASGIHLLLATQRPSVDVITGLIKANIPTRIAFSVSSQVDSKTILDSGGAEKLLGKGDMLFTENGAGKSIRLQGAFVSDDEIDRVTDYARSIAEPDYQFEQEQLLDHYVHDEETDDLLNDAMAFVVEQKRASTSLLQRQFKIGYNRAARLMDAMEERGIIAEQNGSKPRDVLVTSIESDN